MARPDVQITVFFKREGAHIIAFAPALDLSTSGRTLPEAKQKFEKALDLFFEELEDMGTTEKALTELGWQRVSTPAQPWRAPASRVPTHLLAKRQMRIPLPA